MTPKNYVTNDAWSSRALGSGTEQEEEDADAGAVAPGLVPKMSAAKAAKSAAEKDARIAVS